MSIQHYNVYEGLTAVDYVSSANLEGTYYNGALGNGVGAFIRIPLNTFYVDLNKIYVGDDILLVNQTNSNENGIYTCIETQGIYNFSIIQRRPDFQSVEQMREGQYVSCGRGAINAGAIFTLISPLPNVIGIDPLTFNSSSPNEKTVTIDQGMLGNIDQPSSGLVLLDNLSANVTVPLTDPTSKLIGSSTLMTVNGITNGVLVGNANQIILSGTVSVTDGIVAVSANNLDLTNATVDGAQIGSQILEITGLGTATDISGLTIQVLLNSSGVTIPTFQRYIGDSDYLFTSEDAVSYVVTAGTGAGQAGDPTHCNAQKALKIRINGSDQFIGLFDTN